MSAGEIIKRTLSDGCACRRWHACISSVSLHHKENRLAHEQKPNNSSSRWKGSPFGEVGWLRDSGMRESVGHLLHYSTRPNEFWSRDGTTRKHTESLESHLTTPDAPISQMTTKKSDLDHFALSLSRRAFSETFLTGPVENPVSTVWPFLLSWNLHRFYQLNKEECPIFGPCKSRKGNLDTSSLPRCVFLGVQISLLPLPNRMLAMEFTNAENGESTTFIK